MGIEPNIPVNPRNGRKPRPYNTELYKKMRSAVERFFGWIKSFRRIIIRYERLASTYKALVTIASIIIHLRYGILRRVRRIFLFSACMVSILILSQKGFSIVR
jgi:hypothetical protein